MNSAVTRLRLRKVTLRHLNPSEAAHVVGGDPPMMSGTCQASNDDCTGTCACTQCCSGPTYYSECVASCPPNYTCCGCQGQTAGC